MGWKSTITITRREAITAIMQAVDKTPYDELSNEELSLMMDRLGIGEEVGLPYHGHNFSVVNTEEEKPKYDF